MREASSNEFLAQRLLRDKITGQVERYDNYPLSKLRNDLELYSPLRIIKIRNGAQHSTGLRSFSGGDRVESNST